MSVEKNDSILKALLIATKHTNIILERNFTSWSPWYVLPTALQYEKTLKCVEKWEVWTPPKEQSFGNDEKNYQIHCSV